VQRATENGFLHSIAMTPGLPSHPQGHPAAAQIYFNDDKAGMTASCGNCSLELRQAHDSQPSWQADQVHLQHMQQREGLHLTDCSLNDALHAAEQLPSHAGASQQACSTLPTRHSSSVASSISIPSNSSNSSSSSNISSDSNCSAAASSTPTSGSGSAVVVTVLDGPSSDDAADGVMTSIYDLYKTRKMYCIMIVVALAALAAPLSNTM
jgi:hypothetical protein